MTWLLLALAGAAGAVARYALVLLVGPRAFPVGTLAVNTAGSFALGLLLTGAATGRLNPQTAVVLGTGFLGAFTTFSTFSWDVVTLVREGRTPLALAYVLLSVGLSCGAALLGHRLGLLLLR